MCRRTRMTMIEILVAFGIGTMALLPLLALFRGGAEMTRFTMEESVAVLHGACLLDFFLALDPTEARNASDAYRGGAKPFDYSSPPFDELDPTKNRWDFQVEVQAEDFDHNLGTSKKLRTYRVLKVHLLLPQGKGKRRVTLAGLVTI